MIKIIFKGKVQGVFFRYFCKKFAEELSIKGYAKNLKDGSVEVFVIGKEENLKKFLEKIKKNPGYGNIKNTQIFFTKNKKIENFEDFKIF